MGLSRHSLPHISHVPCQEIVYGKPLPPVETVGYCDMAGVPRPVTHPPLPQLPPTPEVRHAPSPFCHGPY
jgi:hypothetical protein